LDRDRFEPTVVYFRNPSFLVAELEQAGVKVIQVKKRGRLDLWFIWQLVQILRQGRFDVMHCFAFTGELWGAVARWLLPSPKRPALITSVRGTYEWYSRWQWAIKGRVSAQSCRVVANSHMGAQYACERMGLAQHAISVVHNGVQAIRATPGHAARVRQQLRMSSADLMVLFVGRLVDHKDLPTLLRAAARLRGELPAMRVVIVGDGPLRDDVSRQIVAMALGETVVLLGERRDIPDLIAAADLVVLTSVREGLSNVILEGMMGGKPIIASRAGGNVELVEHELNGLLFNIGDDRGLANALRRLANDEPLRLRLGEGGRMRAHSEFSIASMVQAYEGHYEDAARERAASH
jgi:glycosyltransferase involved in cell wall biosynthesis